MCRSVSQVLNTGGVAAALAAQNLHPTVTIVSEPAVAVALTIEVVVAVADQAAADALAAAFQTSVTDGTLQIALVVSGLNAEVVITDPPVTTVEGPPQPPPPPPAAVMPPATKGANVGAIGELRCCQNLE